MATKRNLRSLTRKITPEYDVNKISKNNGRILKTTIKAKNNNRFDPLPSSKPKKTMDKGKNKEVEKEQETTSTNSDTEMKTIEETEEDTTLSNTISQALYTINNQEIPKELTTSETGTKTHYTNNKYIFRQPDFSFN